MIAFLLILWIHGLWILINETNKDRDYLKNLKK
jgi:hypothetical protein